MNLRIYQNAKRYATKIKYNDPIDLVHDAYVNWYDKTGQDLFDLPERRVMSIISFTFRGWLSKNRWTYDKVTQGQRQYVQFRDDVTEEASTVHAYNKITPEDECVAGELLDRMRELIDIARPPVKEILEYKLAGYHNNEISEELGVSKSLITYYLNKTELKEWMTIN